MSMYTISAECPRCSTEITLDVTVSGSYVAASFHAPAEGPDFDYDAPTSCTHAAEIEEGSGVVAGPYTIAEQTALDEQIMDAAWTEHEAAQYDPRWDYAEDER